jgi:TusA-related sulfurtransferase
MEIDLKDLIWPVSVLQCHEALARLEPGQNLAIAISDPDVVNNVILLIKSRPELEFDQFGESHNYQIRVRRRLENQPAAAEPNRATAK